MRIPFSMLVLFVVFLLIAARGAFRGRLPIWVIMLGGAIAVLISGDIGPIDALTAINADVMLFLFGVFVVGQALESSGYLFDLSYRFFKRARTADDLILMILFVGGAASALLMNDTLAIIGTPLVLLLAKQHRMAPQALLLALAFAVTLGSVPSPIGNPQNLLIAIYGDFSNPFVQFAQKLIVPTVINMMIAFFMLKRFYRESFHGDTLVHVRHELRDPTLARLARFSLALLIILLLVKVTLAFFDTGFDFRLTWMALIAAAPVLLFSRQRWHVLRHVDWRTLIFFAAMFVLMSAVWHSGFIQWWMTQWNGELATVPMVLFVSVLLSQLVSNVPLVALYMPVLMHAGVSSNVLIALAAGSTVAGNMLILGAASNVIIIQSAENKTRHTIGFLEFARIGIPLAFINTVVYWLFLSVF